MENENENLFNPVELPMYDGVGNPRIYLKAYLGWLVGMGKENRLNMRLFVRTLSGPALMCTSSGCDLLKSKYTESLESPKEKESSRKAAESNFGHDKVNYFLAEAQSKDKGKTIVTEIPNAPPLFLKTRKSQTFTLLSEPISVICEWLRSYGIFQSKSSKVSSHSFNPSKQCAFLLGMLGHTTDECHCLKEEIQRLLNHVKIIKRPMNFPKFIWYQSPAIMPMPSHNQVVYPQFPNQVPSHDQNDCWSKIYCTKFILLCIYCKNL
ncbi:hypothetical protein HAX54_051591 [Datura stramonium]|uniref:Uncharacterized protein n=1 Tax=Datura stramonium TaxID=4076 RepID=A0ABS8SXU1_DATST|nr:hypothetical protein [Datura stramonium]